MRPNLVNIVLKDVAMRIKNFSKNKKIWALRAFYHKEFLKVKSDSSLQQSAFLWLWSKWTVFVLLLKLFKKFFVHKKIFHVY